MAGKKLLAFKFGIGKVEELAEILSGLVGHNLALLGRISSGGGLFGQGLEAGDGRGNLAAQNVVRKVEPAVGRIDVFLILGGIGHVHPRGQDAVGAGRIVGRPVDLFLGRALLDAFHVGAEVGLHAADHLVVHGLLGYANGHISTLILFAVNFIFIFTA